MAAKVIQIALLTMVYGASRVQMRQLLPCVPICPTPIENAVTQGDEFRAVDSRAGGHSSPLVEDPKKAGATSSD